MRLCVRAPRSQSAQLAVGRPLVARSAVKASAPDAIRRGSAASMAAMPAEVNDRCPEAVPAAYGRYHRILYFLTKRTASNPIILVLKGSPVTSFSITSDTVPASNRYVPNDTHWLK